ncbi:ABC transporter substrate-binding protein [Flexivirga alba]|uniref:ABC transporter substrate-binding protein n=1 Tax=Flexivirga alba TaxID=702742 RepID=A0ABW2ACY8_9MICO
MRWTKTVALTTAGLTAVSLAACGSGGPSSKGKGDNSNVRSASAAQTKAAVAASDAGLQGPAPAVPGAKKGGTLYLDDSSNPPTMDPSGIYYTDSGLIAAQYLFRALTQYKVVHGQQVLVPDLATNVGTQSADGLTWTFKIKPGLKYSDGSPVKIEDFAYAIKRSFATESVAADGTTYQMQYLKGGNTYKGPFKQPKANFPGVTTQGNDTLVFHLTQKMPSFNYFASFPQFSPIPQSKDTKNDYQKHPLTTGPYEVSTYNIGQKLVLTRNPNWAPASDPVRHNYPDKIQVNFSISNLPSQQRILANSGIGADTINIGALDASLASQVTGAKKNQFVIGPGSCVMYVEMDDRKIPLDIRKAIAYAWPFNEIRKAGGLSNLAYQPATTFDAPSLQGYKKYPALPYAKGQGNGDPAKAKAMLKKANKLGFQLSYYYISDDPAKVAANNARKAGLEKAGFTVKDIPLAKAEYTKKIGEGNAPVNMGQGTPGWCYDWPTGDSVYPVLFNGAYIDQGGGVGMFKNAAVNAQMAKTSAMDPAKAAPKWAALDQELMTKYFPSLPDYYTMSTLTFGRNVNNVVLNSMSQVWLSN